MLAVFISLHIFLLEILSNLTSSIWILNPVLQPHVDFGLKLLGADVMSIPGLYRFVQVILFFLIVVHGQLVAFSCN